MNDAPEPPAWLSDDPPPDPEQYSGARPANGERQPGGRGDQRARREAPKFDVEGELRAFYATIDHPKGRAELAAVLPDTVPVDSFIRTAKTAVQNNPDLLNPAWRRSLMLALTRAAGQGLSPDGKHGALVPRWNDQTREMGIAWQPMVWGIVKLGRATGAIKSIRAHIVFDGEPFDVVAGDEDRIIHRVVPDVVDAAYRGAGPDAFMEKVQAAYCIITAPDGTVTKRWMPRSRIARVRAASRAAKGPWNGPFIDEMILKTVILATAKWIDTVLDSPEANRFREALETDMDAVLEDETQVPEKPGAAPALPPPDAKLDVLEQQIMGALTRQVVGEPVTSEGASTPEPRREPCQAPHGSDAPATVPRQAAPAAQEAEKLGLHPRAGVEGAARLSTEAQEAEGRRKWVAAVTTDIGALSHSQIATLTGSASYRRRYDVLRQENPDLARAVDDALSARMRTLGPPTDGCA